MYGGNAIRESTVRKLFSRSKEDGFDTGDTPRSAKPWGFDEDRLNILIHIDARKCTRELANVMNCDHSTVVHLLSTGKVQNSGVLVPHALSQNHKYQRDVVSTSLLARHRLPRVQHRTFYPVSLLVARNSSLC